MSASYALRLILVALAGVVTGANPYLAPVAWSRVHDLRERRMGERRSWAVVAIVFAVVIGIIAVIAFEGSRFISPRLTNGMLILGLLTLAGAAFAARPSLLRRQIETPSGKARPEWREWLAFAGDAAYYSGPAWALATFVGLEEIRIWRILVPFAVATSGIILSWTSLARSGVARPVWGTAGLFVAALLLLAAYVKLV